ncbi:flagellar export protein FliJ [Treponema pectinovorum]|uniref:flagellar export protein FliJ n=1 Tax=Treponema pectinovorum TaxID=164 RepID=UPI0011F16578|nr:flagellar export protein FliJ [Treponema pectinovorum]
MKKFSFNMQKILDLREFEQDQAQIELGKAISHEASIDNTLEMVARQKVSTVKEADGISDLNELFTANQYLNLLEQRKEKLLQEKTQAQLVTQQKREEMKDAMMKVKALEKLKQARKEEWKAETKRKEEKETDDINNSKIFRS